MVKLLCLSLFIRWDRADRDGSPLQQGQAAPTRGSVTWYTQSFGPTSQHRSQEAHAASRLTTASKKCQLQSQVRVLRTWPVVYIYATQETVGYSKSMEAFKHVLTSTLHTQDANYSLTTELTSLFKKPRQCSVCSAISPGSCHTLFRLIIQKHRDHLQLY